MCVTTIKYIWKRVYIENKDFLQLDDQLRKHKMAKLIPNLWSSSKKHMSYNLDL